MPTRRRTHRLLLALVLALRVGSAWGQSQTGPHDACRTLRANVAGVAKASIVVDTAVVTVVAANRTLCAATVVNVGDQPLNCMSPPDGGPSATAGFRLAPTQVLVLGLSAQNGYACTRHSTATAAGVVSVQELYP